jgi:chorismate mutase
MAEPQTIGSDPLRETAARGVEAIHAIVVERDDLRIQCDRMHTDIMLYRQKIDQLEVRLSEAAAERDHYMRYCTEITVRLNNIQTLIASTVEEAKHAAYKRSNVIPTATKPVVSDKDIAELGNLIARLPTNGNSKQ